MTTAIKLFVSYRTIENPFSDIPTELHGITDVGGKFDPAQDSMVISLAGLQMSLANEAWRQVATATKYVLYVCSIDRNDFLPYSLILVDVAVVTKWLALYPRFSGSSSSVALSREVTFGSHKLLTN